MKAPLIVVFIDEVENAFPVKEREPDVLVRNEGSIFLVHPLTEAAKQWLGENVEDGNYWGDALIVEHRYITSLVYGLQAEGFVVRG